MKLLFLLLFTAFALGACTQSNTPKETRQPAVYKNIGGPCEGCEAIHESPVPFAGLHPVDTLPDFSEKGPRLEISGTVYQQDGRTPAQDVVLYIYHTDQQGYYSKRGGEQGWGKRHGYLRGWIKTGANGRYTFYTLKPAPYPGHNDPAHIHITVKEPGKNEYWIDDFQFEDDPLLTAEKRSRQQNRGGTGIVQLKKEKGLWKVSRNLILGKNIPGYPTALSDVEFSPGLLLIAIAP